MDSSAGGCTAVDGGAGPLQAGQVVDGFRLDERLHRGGMAELWRVQRVAGQGRPADPSDAMPLVMKVPRIAGGEEPAAIVGFEVERMITPTLQGPHVPRFVAQGDFTRQPFIVMEHIPGPSLRERLQAAPLPLDEVVDIGRRVATALHDLHRQHVVHHDLKPGNILQRADGTVVLVDYGLARHEHLPDLLDEEFTLPMGTGPYISPEQVQFVRSDARSDLFALGVLLYHLSTGQRPFGAPTTVRGLRRRLTEEPVPPRALRTDCPPWLQELVLKCLEVAPDERYQSAAQIAMQLQAPEQIPLTSRAHRLRRSGPAERLARWWTALRRNADAPRPAVSQLLDRCPIVLAAVDVEGASAPMLAQLAETTRRLLLTEPGARLACVGVMRTARIGMDERADRAGQSLHVRQLVALKHWARPIGKSLGLGEGRLTFHVLEAPDPAAAIIDFARRNGVDQIVMGARGQSALRRYLGSVSSRVVAESECSVTVVRARGRA